MFMIKTPSIDEDEYEDADATAYVLPSIVEMVICSMRNEMPLLSWKTVLFTRGASQCR